MEKKVIVALALLAVAAHAAFAVPSELSISPNPLWADAGKTITATFRCGANESAGSVRFVNSNYIFQCSTPTLSNSVYTAVCDLSSYAGENIYGPYNIVVECVGNETTNATITGLINTLSIDSFSLESDSIYSGEDVKVSFRLKKNDQYLCSNVVADLYLDENVVVGRNVNPLCDLSTNTLKVVFPTSQLGDLPEGWYDVKLVAKYQEGGEHSASKTLQSGLYIKPTYRISLQGVDSISVVGDSEISVPVVVSKKGVNMKGLSESDFRLKVYKGSSLYTSLKPVSVEEGDNSYTLKFFMADMPSGKYRGKISLMVGGVQKASTSDFTIESKMPLEIGFVDSHGKAYDGTLILKSPSFSKSFRAGSDGLIEDSVLAGNYTVILDVAGMRVELRGVSIENGLQNPFRIDFPGNTAELEGINAANIYVFESAVPFTSADVQLRYDDTRVYDEMRLNVYACHNWNYGRRRCSGKWEEVDGVVKDTVRNIVRFNTTRFSAFVIGERKQLFFSAEMAKSRYYRGEDISLTGKVVDSNSNPVEGVKVSYEFEGLNETGYGTTDAAGFFHIMTRAPDYNGNVKLVLSAEKNPYIPARMSTLIEVYSKPDVSITIPQSVSVRLGEKKNFTIDVMNTGQVNLSSLKISITGIDPKWYDYFPQFLDLNVGERKTVTVVVKIPIDDCEERQCKDFYFIKAKAWNDDISREETSTLKLEVPEQTPGSAGLAGTVSSVTAKLIAMPADQWALSVVVLGIFTSFMVFGRKVKRGIGKGIGDAAKAVKGFSFSGSGNSGEDRMERLTRIKTTLKVEPERHSRLRAKPFRFKFKE